MPWTWVGRWCFDLARVDLVEQVEPAERSAGAAGGITVRLRNGDAVELTGDDASAFLSAWNAHASPRPVGPESRVVLTPVLSRPARPPDLPGKTKG